MLQVAKEFSNGSETFLDPGRDAISCWYAAYTIIHHEKRVAEQLEMKSIEQFLPTYESVRRWKDRQMQLDVPLFPGYLFVRIPMDARVKVLQISGVVRLVGFNGCPLALPDSEIEALRQGLKDRLRIEPHPYLTIGRRVRIRTGPLKGMEGILVNRKGNFRVVLSIQLIMRSLSAEVDVADLEFLSSPHHDLPE